LHLPSRSVGARASRGIRKRGGKTTCSLACLYPLFPKRLCFTLFCALIFVLFVVFALATKDFRRIFVAYLGSYATSTCLTCWWRAATCRWALAQAHVPISEEFINLWWFFLKDATRLALSASTVRVVKLPAAARELYASMVRAQPSFERGRIASTAFSR